MIYKQIRKRLKFFHPNHNFVFSYEKVHELLRESLFSLYHLIPLRVLFPISASFVREVLEYLLKVPSPLPLCIMTASDMSHTPSPFKPYDSTDGSQSSLFWSSNTLTASLPDILRCTPLSRQWGTP